MLILCQAQWHFNLGRLSLPRPAHRAGDFGLHGFLDLNRCLQCLGFNLSPRCLLGEGPQVRSEEHTLRPARVRTPYLPKMIAYGIVHDFRESLRLSAALAKLVIALCDLPDMRVHRNCFVPAQPHEADAVRNLGADAGKLEECVMGSPVARSLAAFFLSLFVSFAPQSWTVWIPQVQQPRLRPSLATTLAVSAMYLAR